MRTVVIVLLLGAVLMNAAPPQSSGGIWSRQATSIWGTREELRIPSPDGKNVILVRRQPNSDSDETHVVAVRVSGREFKTTIGFWVNSEALWSPDSKAFAVTYSDGGNIGTYHVKVFHVSPLGLRIVEPIANGRRLLAPWCFDQEYPNVGAIRWMGQNSSKLLLAVQVPPHSSCASMGTFRAFEVNAKDGTVGNRFGQLEAKKLFADSLGGELRDADDSCVRKPETCVPSGLKHK